MARSGLIAVIFGISAAPSGAACRMALAIGLDVSHSIDASEYRLQLDGLAAALLSPDVESAMLDLPDHPVRLLVFEWAGPGSQRRIIDWLVVLSAADLARTAAVLREQPRLESVSSTAIGEAILYGSAALSANSNCWRRVLDLSGDGQSNAGILPRDLSDNALLGVIVNGLVVGGEYNTKHGLGLGSVTEVYSHYSGEVIRGPGAFVEVAASFSEFEAAMVRKLLRELQSPAVVRLGE